jgi:hypothetical protein
VTRGNHSDARAGARREFGPLLAIIPDATPANRGFHSDFAVAGTKAAKPLPFGTGWLYPMSDYVTRAGTAA